MKEVKHIVKKSFVYLLIIISLTLGVVGLALPFVPQVIFFAIALILISFEVPWVESKIEKTLQRWPKVLKMYLKLKGKIEKYLR